MSDLGTMPVRELITDLRKQAAELPREDFIRTLFVNIMVRRIEQEADRADKAEQRVADLTALAEGLQLACDMMREKKD
jgi:hypothetical protein